MATAMTPARIITLAIVMAMAITSTIITIIITARTAMTTATLMATAHPVPARTTTTMAWVRPASRYPE